MDRQTLPTFLSISVTKERKNGNRTIVGGYSDFIRAGYFGKKFYNHCKVVLHFGLTLNHT